MTKKKDRRLTALKRRLQKKAAQRCEPSSGCTRNKQRVTEAQLPELPTSYHWEKRQLVNMTAEEEAEGTGWTVVSGMCEISDGTEYDTIIEQAQDAWRDALSAIGLTLEEWFELKKYKPAAENGRAGGLLRTLGAVTYVTKVRNSIAGLGRLGVALAETRPEVTCWLKEGDFVYATLWLRPKHEKEFRKHLGAKETLRYESPTRIAAEDFLPIYESPAAEIRAQRLREKSFGK